MFYDSLINADTSRLGGFCQRLISEKAGIIWSANMKVGNMDEKLLKVMRKAGCCNISLGIEFCSDRLLQSSGKGFTVQEASQTLSLANRAGLRVHMGLIAGYPYETQADIDRTVCFVEKHKKYIHSVSLMIFCLTHNSLMQLYPEKYGVTNLRTKRMFNFSYAFDEINGLAWVQKKDQQLNSYAQINRVIKRLFSNGG